MGRTLRLSLEVPSAAYRRRRRPSRSPALAHSFAGGALVPAALAAHVAAGNACASLSAAVAGRAAAHRPAGRAAHVAVGLQLNRSGELIGHLLDLTTSRGETEAVALPPESAISAPLGSVVVYTSAPGNGPSEVHAVSLETGCDTRLALRPDIARSAVLDPDGTAVYVHAVSRADRSDAGVTRIELDSGRQELVVPPLPPSDEFGPTFGTELHWSTTGAALAVQSCGMSDCRTRVLDVGSGTVATFDAPGRGEFIGLTPAHLISYADCSGLPCDVLSTDLASRETTLVATDADSAALETDDPGHPLLHIESTAGIVEVVQ